jgi:hypothetical protein
MQNKFTSQLIKFTEEAIPKLEIRALILTGDAGKVEQKKLTRARVQLHNLQWYGTCHAPQTPSQKLRKNFSG